MKPMVIAVVFAALLILASIALYQYLRQGLGSSQSSASSNYSSTGPDASISTAGNESWRGVEVEIRYNVVNKESILDIARKFIESQLPAPASRDNTSTINWLSTSIAVLKIDVELTNNSTKPVYYVTNFLCGVQCGKINCSKLRPIAWRISSSIAVPKVHAEKGAVFPMPIECTMDLRYEKVPPKSSIVNEYYFIVTRPFKGSIGAKATICLEKPFSSACRVEERSTQVIISGDKPTG